MTSVQPTFYQFPVVVAYEIVKKPRFHYPILYLRVNGINHYKALS